MIQLHLSAAWIGILAGMFSGALIGLMFHNEGWLGGYQSWPRRLLRLGHISFFGIAFLNLGLALTIELGDESWMAAVASPLLLAGAVLMPTVCLLSAWRKPFRHLFFLPVCSLLGAGLALVIGGIGS